MSTYKSTINDTIKMLERGDRRVIKSLALGIEKGMRAFENKMIKEQFTGRPGLNRQTGNAARSWNTRKKIIGGRTISVSLSTSVKYIERFQTGKPLKAKPGKALAIPLRPSAKGTSPRDHTDLFMIKPKGRSALLVKKSGAGIEPMFVLKKEVRSPKYLKVYESFRKDGWKLIKKAAKNQLVKDAKRGWKL